MSQVIRAFEYLSTFSFKPSIFSVQKPLESSFHQGTVNEVENYLGSYFSDKLTQQLNKLKNFELIKHEDFTYTVQ